MNEWEWNLLEDKNADRSHLEIDGVPVNVGDRVRLRSQKAATFSTSPCATRSRSSKALKRTTKARNTSASSSKTIPGATSA